MNKPATMESPNVVPLLLKPREAAQALTISARSLWALTNAGTIPCVRLGKMVRYDPHDLRNFIDRRKKT